MTSSWQESIRTALRSTRELSRFFAADFPETNYPIFIPRNLATRIKESGLNSPLAKQFLPVQAEISDDGLVDPIGDHTHSPTKQIVHRYKNRLLFFPTNTCPVQCRYCFRKNELHHGDELFKPDFEGVKNYLRDHPEVEEVIFSGGDPLMLSNQKLESYFNEFAALGISMLRLHSRMPIITPERLDEEFFSLLEVASEKFDVVSVVIHLNHADEITPEFIDKMKLFRRQNVQWLSQTVLLKKINDDAIILANLFKQLLKLGVRPYYLHHPDQVRGGMHFYLSIPHGRKVYAQLRDLLPGHAIPQYVLDIPGGHGKIPIFNPEGHSFSNQLLDKDGQLIELN